MNPCYEKNRGRDFSFFLFRYCLMAILKRNIASINIDKNEITTTLSPYPNRKKRPENTAYMLYISETKISRSKANLKVMLQSGSIFFVYLLPII